MVGITSYGCNFFCYDITYWLWRACPLLEDCYSCMTDTAGRCSSVDRYVIFCQCAEKCGYFQLFWVSPALVTHTGEWDVMCCLSRCSGAEDECAWQCTAGWCWTCECDVMCCLSRCSGAEDECAWQCTAGWCWTCECDVMCCLSRCSGAEDACAWQCTAGWCTHCTTTFQQTRQTARALSPVSWPEESQLISTSRSVWTWRLSYPWTTVRMICICY